MTVVQTEPATEEPARLARGSESMRLSAMSKDRPTCAMHKDELLGLIQQTGGLDPEIEVVTRAPTEPPAIIVDSPEPAALIVNRPAPEALLHERPTCAIDPGELRLLMRPPVLPVYHGRSRWALIAAIAAALVAIGLLLI